MIFIRRNRKKDKPTHRDRRDGLEFLLPPELLKLEGADIQSIRTGVDIVADLGCPVDSADGSLESVTPIRIGVLEEPLELDVVLVHVPQLTLLPLQGRRVILCLIRVLRSGLRLQHRNFLSQGLCGTGLLGNQSSLEAGVSRQHSESDKTERITGWDCESTGSRGILPVSTTERPIYTVENQHTHDL